MATSTLNPNAPIFVPSAYRRVEDFSDEWWNLVHSSPSFRDYWLRECFSDPQNDPVLADICDFDFFLSGDGDDDDAFFSSEEEKNGDGSKDLVSLGAFKWQKSRMEAPRYAEKAPKIVKMKVGPRQIQQPR